MATTATEMCGRSGASGGSVRAGFVVSAGSGSARLRHGVVAWGGTTSMGSPGTRSSFLTTPRATTAASETAPCCSLIAQGVAEISSGGGYGRAHLYAGNGRVAVTSQGSLHTFDLITGRGFSWDAIGEQRGTSMNLDGTWYLRSTSTTPGGPLSRGSSALVLSRPPTRGLTATTGRAGCPAHELSSTFWLRKSSCQCSPSISAVKDHTLRLYHKDDPLQAYSNSVTANSLGYGIVWAPATRSGHS